MRLVTRVVFADLPSPLRAEIADKWGVLEHDAGRYFDTTTAEFRWSVISAVIQTSPIAALQTYLAQAGATTLRDLGHLLLARSRALEMAA